MSLRPCRQERGDISLQRRGRREPQRAADPELLRASDVFLLVVDKDDLGRRRPDSLQGPAERSRARFAASQLARRQDPVEELFPSRPPQEPDVRERSVGEKIDSVPIASEGFHEPDRPHARLFEPRERLSPKLLCRVPSSKALPEFAESLRQEAPYRDLAC